MSIIRSPAAVVADGRQTRLRWFCFAWCASAVLALFIGHSAYAAASARVEQESGSSTRVQATLVKQIPAIAMGGGRAFVPSSRVFEAEWTATDGEMVTGTVIAPPDAQTGMAFDLWVDRETGLITDEPMTRKRAISQTTAAVLLTLLGCGTVILVMKKHARLTARGERP